MELDRARGTVLVAGLGVPGPRRPGCCCAPAPGCCSPTPPSRRPSPSWSRPAPPGSGPLRDRARRHRPGGHLAGLAAGRPAAGRRRRAAGVEVVGEPELAWRLRVAGPDGEPAPWLAVTGTNGKTTTVTMLEAILLAAGRRAVAAGNVGRPLVEVVTAVERRRHPDLRRGRRRALQLPAALVVVARAGGGRRAQRRRRPHRLARVLRRLPGREGPHPAASRRSPSPTPAIRWPPRSSAGHPHPVTVTLGEPAPGQLGVRSGAPGRPRVRRRPGRRAAARPGRPAGPGAAQPGQRPGRGGAGPGDRRPRRGGRPRAGRLPRRGAPQRARRHRRRRRLRRRQQGDQSARGGRLPGRLPAGGLDRRRPAQGRRRRSAGRGGRRTARPGWSCWAATATGSPPRWRDTPRWSPW